MHPVSRRPLVVSLIRLAALPLIVAGAFACAPAAISVQVNLVTQMCNPMQTFPYNGATIQFTIYGQGVNSEELQTTSTIQSGVANIPSIPAGSARNIVAEVLDSNNLVVAHGETGPTDINSKSLKLNLTLFIRPVNMFVPANSAAAPQSCTSLIEPRYAHTATVLDNGKVLIAGGYSVSSGAQPSPQDSTEIYDPQAGTITAGPSLQIARAYAAAAHLPGTKFTLIIGGEGSSPGNAALDSAELYDEDQNQFVGLPALAGAAMTGGITRAVAAVPLAVPGGGQPDVILIFGGDNLNGVPQAEIQSFDPNNGFRDTGLTMPEGRAEAGAVPIPGGVLVVGGLGGVNASTALMDVTGLTSPDNSHFAVFSNAMPLSSGHIFPIAGALADGSILTLDGLSSATQNESILSSATNAMDWVSPTYENTMVVPQPPMQLPARGWGGGAALLDGTLLAAGGGNFNGSTSTALDDGTILYLSGASVASLPVANSMQNGRVGAAYTLLTDGTVLITGGYDFDSGNPASVASIDVYQPAYQTTSTSAHQIIQ